MQSVRAQRSPGQRHRGRYLALHDLLSAKGNAHAPVPSFSSSALSPSSQLDCCDSPDQPRRGPWRPREQCTIPSPDQVGKDGSYRLVRALPFLWVLAADLVTAPPPRARVVDWPIAPVTKTTLPVNRLPAVSRAASYIRAAFCGAETIGVDDEAVADVGAEYPLVRLVDGDHVDELRFGHDAVLRAEVEHLLRLEEAAGG